VCTCGEFLEVVFEEEEEKMKTLLQFRCRGLCRYFARVWVGGVDGS
jgi:hypothetical protein